jgi:hypothetical protein
MFMAFAKKGKKRRHHQVLPEPAQSSNATQVSKEVNEQGILAANICKERFKLFDGSEEPTWKAILQCVEALQQEVSNFRSEDKHWSACLSQ